MEIGRKKATSVSDGDYSMKRLLTDFILQYKWKYILGISLIVASSLLTLAIPRLLGLITDCINLRYTEGNQLTRYIQLLLAASLLIFIIKFIWRYLIVGNCRNVEVYLRSKLFKHLQTLSSDFFNTHKTGDLIAYAINDIQAIRKIFGGGFVQSVDAIVISLFSMIFMSGTINPRLTAAIFIPAPIIVITIYHVRGHIRKRFKKVQEAFALISDKAQENISGIRVIKAFSQEAEETDSFKAYSQTRVDAQMDLVKVSGFLVPFVNSCFGLVMLIFIIYASRLILNNEITVGDFVAFNSYILTFMTPVINVTKIIETWQQGTASFKRLDVIFREKPDIEADSFDDDTIRIKGDIEIRELNFTYPEASRRALKNINIKIKRGCTLGVLGKTGSGKTTLVNLLLRLYKVEDGHIFIDNQDINTISPDILRESVGYVPQDSFLFSTTIKSNIEFFKSVYSDDEIETAAKLSDVFDNITAFPDGFNTVVGERGATLSGGQKQRISIARAIIKRASILILDDCLSAVDTETENRILQNFKVILANRTGIIISHRISTVMDADEIIFLENGKIIERGSHDQLMDIKGRYYNLYQAQTDKLDAEEVAPL